MATSVVGLVERGNVRTHAIDVDDDRLGDLVRNACTLPSEANPM